MRGEPRLYVRDLARDRDTALIGEAREEAADAIRRELVDVRRNDAPGTLDEELHREGAEHEQRRGGRECPQRDREHGSDERQADRAAAAQPVGIESAKHTTSERAHLRERRERRTRRGTPTPIPLEKSGI